MSRSGNENLPECSVHNAAIFVYCTACRAGLAVLSSAKRECKDIHGSKSRCGCLNNYIANGPSRFSGECNVSRSLVTEVRVPDKLGGSTSAKIKIIN